MAQGRVPGGAGPIILRITKEMIAAWEQDYKAFEQNWLMFGWNIPAFGYNAVDKTYLQHANYMQFVVGDAVDGPRYYENERGAPPDVNWVSLDKVKDSLDGAATPVWFMWVVLDGARVKDPNALYEQFAVSDHVPPQSRTSYRKNNAFATTMLYVIKYAVYWLNGTIPEKNAASEMFAAMKTWNVKIRGGSIRPVIQNANKTLTCIAQLLLPVLQGVFTDGRLNDKWADRNVVYRAFVNTVDGSIKTSTLPSGGRDAAPIISTRLRNPSSMYAQDNQYAELNLPPNLPS
jgi:hypothetical protein